MFNNAGRLRVNMGNIYFKLGQYAKAIKFYRMALDQVGITVLLPKYGGKFK